METYIYKLFCDDLSVDEFKQWVYDSDDLRKLLRIDDYLVLNSLNYESINPRPKIRRIMEQYFDFGEFETNHLLSLLYRALNNRNELAEVLRNLYDLYCDGYHFLQDLGLGYGLYCKVPPNKYKAENWEELSETEQDQIIDNFYPQVTRDIARAINWLENSHIVLTGKRDDTDRLMYDDNRTEDEKESAVWVEVQKDRKTGTSIRTNILWERQERSWWGWRKN